MQQNIKRRGRGVKGCEILIITGQYQKVIVEDIIQYNITDWIHWFLFDHISKNTVVTFYIDDAFLYTFWFIL